jgi:DNA repair exonuclease SbcCD ATPase subunit
MIRRLEDIQRMDQQERDRAFYKRKISELGQEKEAICKQIGWLQKEIEILEGRNCLPREDSGKRQRIYALENEINRCFSRQIACEKEMTKLLERLAHLEEYWEALETVAESREKALAWMQTLPAGHEGTAQFLNGLTGEYVRAFALSISIYSPYCYCIHWFDDSKTDVKMDSNVEDFRRTKVQV